MRTAYDVVIRPIITEQSMEDLDIKKYAFEVAKDANKIEIKTVRRHGIRRNEECLLKLTDRLLLPEEE